MGRRESMLRSLLGTRKGVSGVSGNKDVDQVGGCTFAVGVVVGFSELFGGAAVKASQGSFLYTVGRS